MKYSSRVVSVIMGVALVFGLVGTCLLYTSDAADE